MSKVQHRDISNILQLVRKFLNCGREPKNYLRFEDEMSKRTPSVLPNLPDGVHHRLSGNYYLNRDGRRSVKPPLVIKDAENELNNKQITS